MVFENGKTACIITQTEMQKSLTKAEYDFATGCSRPTSSATKTTGAAGATKKGASASASAASAAAAADAAQRQRDKEELERMVASDPSPAVKA